MKIVPNHTENDRKSRSGVGVGGSWSLSGRVGSVLGCLGASWGRLGGVMGANLDPLGTLLNSPWVALGTAWGV